MALSVWPCLPSHRGATGQLSSTSWGTVFLPVAVFVRRPRCSSPPTREMANVKWLTLSRSFFSPKSDRWPHLKYDEYSCPSVPFPYVWMLYSVQLEKWGHSIFTQTVGVRVLPVQLPSPEIYVYAFPSSSPSV